MNKIINIINEEIRLLFENENNLILYHGSSHNSVEQIYTSFYDNQFFTINETIAASYAYNHGGLVYKVSVNNLNPWIIEENATRMKRTSSGFKIAGSDEYWYNIFLKLYDKNVADYYKKIGFSYGFGRLINGNAIPLINAAKVLGYDSLKFMDESFDVTLHDITYVVFDGKKPKIIDVFEIEMDDMGYEFILKSIK